MNQSLQKQQGQSLDRKPGQIPLAQETLLKSIGGLISSINDLETFLQPVLRKEPVALSESQNRLENPGPITLVSDQLLAHAKSIDAQTSRIGEFIRLIET